MEQDMIIYTITRIDEADFGCEGRPEGYIPMVTVYLEEDGEEETWQVVTTVRQDVLHGLISKESPVGKAVLGHKVGDRVTVQVNENYSYDIVIRAVEKGQDDASLPISSY